MKDVLSSPRYGSADGFDRYNIFHLGFVLCLVQLADGFLTCIGVYHYGPQAEANLFIKHLMVSIGPVEALMTVKSLSIAGVLILCKIGREIGWLREAMLGLIAIYLHCAILPWTIFIAFKAS